MSVIPCRSEPADQAEMISQLLFGDHYKVIETRAKWVKVRNAFDKYEGWIDRKQWHEISKKEYTRLDKEAAKAVVSDLVGVVRVNNQHLQTILMGSSLPGIKQKVFEVNGITYEYEGSYQSLGEKPSKGKLVENAFMYRNVPYLWGGKHPFGIDCSGFSQMVYKMNGKSLPRDAYQQAEIGTTLSFVEEAEPGDLAFFDNEEGRIIHVGILLEDAKIIHASGHVRIDPIDHQGIYLINERTYSHKLRLIKKIIK